MRIKSFLQSLAIVIATLSGIDRLSAAERMALVIGNNAYEHSIALQNPVNDAKAIKERLEKGGWAVTLAEDTNVRDLRRAVRLFADASKEADAAMVFFAGHGIEVKGKNYLLPVDAKLDEADAEDALPLETLPLEDLLKQLGEAGARLKIVVLDCCRDNPIQRSWLKQRSSGGGLAAVAEADLAEGTMLIFSTAPGRTAADGRGENSPFTTQLLKRMARGGGALSVFGDVAVSMGSGQEAWIRFDGSGRSLASFQAFPLLPEEVAAPMVMNSPPSEVPGPAASLPPNSPSSTLHSQVDLPPSGYFDLEQLFQGGPYESYNDYSKREVLKKVQMELKTSGHYSNTIDGKPGNGTQQALFAWQQKHNLRIDGRLNQLTLRAMGMERIAETDPPVPQHKKDPVRCHSKLDHCRLFSLGGCAELRTGWG